MSDLKIVILAGGSGTRLWPVSSKRSPKQVIDFGIKESMILQAVRKSQKLGAVYIVAGTEHVEEIDRELTGLKYTIISEPYGKNTAPAVALGASYLWRKNPKSNLVFIPVDQDFNESELEKAVLKVAEVVNDTGKIVLTGTKPEKPDPGYGYIETGKKLGDSIYSIKKIMEKPTKNELKRIELNGGYLWNIFIVGGRAEQFKKSFETHLPDIAKLFKTDNPIELYRNFKPTGVEKGLFSKNPDLIVVEAKMQWRDIGNWRALHKVLEKDISGNCYIGEKSFGIKNKNTLIFNKTDKIIATIGLKNIIIATTDNEILIANLKYVDQVGELEKMVNKDKE